MTNTRMHGIQMFWLRHGVDRAFVDQPLFLDKVCGNTGEKLYGPTAGEGFDDNQLRFSIICQVIRFNFPIFALAISIAMFIVFYWYVVGYLSNRNMLRFFLTSKKIQNSLVSIRSALLEGEKECAIHICMLSDSLSSEGH